MTILSIIREVGINSLLDIGFITILIYTGLVWIKRTKAGFVLTGIVIVAGLYLLARQFNLVMTTSLFEKFFAVILITLIVIFQEDLKHFFEQIAVWSLNRRFQKKNITVSFRSSPEVDILIRTVMDLSRERIGALIVLRGKDTIIRHLDGGEELDGVISEPLLKSIFDPHSIGHDGAVLIEDNKIKKFSCHLPLTKNLKKVKDHGTRHAAALGLSELTDALCLVVSEEKGTISVAQDGNINKIQDPDRLKSLLEDFYQEVNPKQIARPWQGFLRRNTREKLYALLMSIALWLVFVYGAKEVYQTYKIPVSYTNTPASWVVQAVDPQTIGITLRGPRKTFYFISKDQIKVSLKLDHEKNQQTVRIHPEDLIFPKSAKLQDFEPKEIKIIMEKQHNQTK